MKHLFTAANLTEQYSFIAKGVLALDELKEISQFLDPNSDSDFDPEDPRSNLEGVKLGVELSSYKITKETIQQVVEFINGLGAIDPSDARLSKDNVLIQENSSDKYRAPNRSILDLNYYRPFYGHVPSSPDTILF